MRARILSTRSFGLFSAGAMLLAGLLVSAAPGYASTRDHDVPGKLMGSGGASGVVDSTTNPRDVYAVQLFAKQPVVFNFAWNGHDDNGTFGTRLVFFAPGVLTVDDADSLSYTGGFGGHAINYTPAVTGVYYLEAKTPGHGVTYTITVSGSAGMPSSATVWRTGVTPGVSTWLHGALSPSFTSAPLRASTVQLQESTNRVNWSVTRTLSGEGTFDVSVTPPSPRWYRFYYAGDGGYAGSTSASVQVKPGPSVYAPHAPSTMSHSRYYTIYGYLKPRHTAGTHPVRIYKYRYVSGHWKSYGYVSAKASNYSTYTKYSVSVKLAYTGKWRVRAYAPADSGHAAAWSSGYDYVTVK